MGYVPPGVLSPAVDRVVAGLKKGELSAVLESAEGFTLLRCDDIFASRVIPLDEARTIIRQALWSRTTRTRQAELRAELLKEAAPRYAETPGADDAAAVAFRGGRLTEAELGWLAGPSVGSPETRRALLEEQVYQFAAAARARERGLDRDPLLRARVEVQRARLLATAEVARRIDQSKLRPTEAEKRARYERDRERYRSLPEADVSVIAWPVSESTELRRRSLEAEALLGRVRTGEVSFEEAARQVSVLPSAAAGGRLGFLVPEQLASFGPNIFRTVEQMSPGETSGLVQQDQQLLAVKLWERKPSRPLAFEEVAARIEQELGDARVAEVQKGVQEAASRELGFALAAASGAP
jgi:peptidyl-prolyl cis-trans isomerase C